MVQIVLSQSGRQQPHQEGGLAASLSTDERRHTFIAVDGVHLQPVGHNRPQPRGQIAHQLRVHPRQAVEESSHVVLAVPSRQVLQIVGDGVEGVNLIGVDILHDVRLWRAVLTESVTLCADDDSVESRLSQRFPLRLL